MRHSVAGSFLKITLSQAWIIPSSLPPSLKVRSVRSLLKIIINEAPLDKQQNQRNHYQNNFSGEIKQYAQPSLDTVVSTFNIAK